METGFYDVKLKNVMSKNPNLCFYHLFFFFFFPIQYLCELFCGERWSLAASGSHDSHNKQHILYIHVIKAVTHMHRFYHKLEQGTLLPFVFENTLWLLLLQRVTLQSLNSLSSGKLGF